MPRSKHTGKDNVINFPTEQRPRTQSNVDSVPAGTSADKPIELEWKRTLRGFAEEMEVGLRLQMLLDPAEVNTVISERREAKRQLQSERLARLKLEGKEQE